MCSPNKQIYLVPKCLKKCKYGERDKQTGLCPRKYEQEYKLFSINQQRREQQIQQQQHQKRIQQRRIQQQQNHELDGEDEEAEETDEEEETDDESEDEKLDRAFLDKNYKNDKDETRAIEEFRREQIKFYKNRLARHEKNLINNKK